MVYTDRLIGLTGKVDNFILAENGLIETPYIKVKVISRGELNAKIELETQFASKTAIAALTNAGGSFKKEAMPQRVANKAA